MQRFNTLVHRASWSDRQRRDGAKLVARTVADALPNHPTLVGIKPHILRHAGMTYWFASGADEKRIQKWGGWTSLVQMLDTYRGVIDSLEHLNLDGLDRFAEAYEDAEPIYVKDHPAKVVAVADGEAGTVVNLDDYRRRRLG